ncbi:hypothetical protein [Synoicihabitans lomoniglobus]|uniref:Uncharacterized protein n=1 Tax=Synoicihabitans lomoniglobus TaxID=2909285 RepID=A0AAF0CP18_9BACT|nr:hypothetical protein [Opitutaceae bacterium LMO-M01]WED65436.1 hypothetical protein PXH66_01055 [Opitutaceae bacterium LMO-M01]
MSQQSEPSPNPNPEVSNVQKPSVDQKAKIKQQKIEQTGLNSRIRGHVSARGRRDQAKSDSKG